MADISNEIAAIGAAVYGEEVRTAIADALTAMNAEAQAAEEWATGGTGGTASEENNAKAYAERAEAAAETLEIDATLSQSGQAADAAATGAVKASLELVDSKFDGVTQLVKYWVADAASQAASTNQPKRRIERDRVSVNGSVGSSVSSFLKMSGAKEITTGSTTRNNWSKDLALVAGHRYRLGHKLLSGSMTGTAFAVLRDEDNNTICSVGVGVEKDVTWVSGSALIYESLSSGSTYSDAELVITLEDLTVSEADVNIYKAGLIDIFPGDKDVGKGYSGTTSSIVDASSYNISDYIPVSVGHKIAAYSCPPYSVNGGEEVATFVNTSDTTEFCKIAYYDESKTWIETIDTNDAGYTDPWIWPKYNGYLRIQHRARNSVRVFEDGVRYLEAEKVAPSVVDLILFLGQSNMAGRGVTNTTWTEEAPRIDKNAGFEFRAISDPTKLYIMQEPFGKGENVTNAINDGTSKSGGCVTAFCNTYHEKTGVTVVGVSASEGGTKISQWQPEGARLTDAISRFTTAVTWLTSNGYTIRHKFLAFCLGESDGDSATTAEDWTAGYHTMFNALKAVGVEKCFLFRIGEYNGTGHNDYTTIMNAQTAICKTDPDTILVTADQSSFKARGLMKDSFHYYQAGYNEMGRFGGSNAAYYVLSGKEPTMFDTKASALYYSEIN